MEERCDFCKISHTGMNKHVYSKRHRSVIDHILQKFSKKVKEAVKTSKCPEVFAEGWEKGAKFWCYFCSQDIPKHLVEENMSIKNQALLLHLTASSHHHQTHVFWWNHRLPKQRITEYILDEKVYHRFLKKLDAEKVKFEDESRTAKEKVMEDIRKADKARMLITEGHEFEGLRMLNKPKIGHNDFRSCNYRQNVIAGARIRNLVPTTGSQTVIVRQSTQFGYLQGMANGDATSDLKNVQPTASCSYKQYNLQQGFPDEEIKLIPIKFELSYGEKQATYVGKQSVGGGNVHTGAVPPWLTSSYDGPTTSFTEIGPTISDYNDHLKREKKSKLNPNRVGASFDHNTPTSASWLPSFGRVWNMGRRWQSRHDYRRERKSSKSQPKPSTKTSNGLEMPSEPRSWTSTSSKSSSSTTATHHISSQSSNTNRSDLLTYSNSFNGECNYALPALRARDHTNTLNEAARCDVSSVAADALAIGNWSVNSYS